MTAVSRMRPLSSRNRHGHRVVTDHHRELRRAQQADITYPLPDGMTDDEINARLFPPLPPPNIVRTEPDWQWVHRELRKKSVTLDMLRQERGQRFDCYLSGMHRSDVSSNHHTIPHTTSPFDQP